MVAASNRNDSVSISLTREDLTCPITNELIFDLRTVNPCGHLFEAEAIEDYLSHQTEQNDKAVCPCCRGSVEAVSKNQYIADQFNEAFLSKPEWLEDRYCSLYILNNALLERNNIVIERIFAVLRAQPNRLKEIVEEGIYKDHSYLSVLVANQFGRQCLRNNPDLLQNIDKKVLNHIKTRGRDIGSSLLHWLIKIPEWQELIFTKYQHLFDPATINSVVKNGVYEGLSPLYFLAATVQGRNLLLGNEDLRRSITRESLFAIFRHEKNSAFDYLKESVVGQDILNLMNPEITSEEENKIEVKPFYSPLFSYFTSCVPTKFTDSMVPSSSVKLKRD